MSTEGGPPYAPPPPGRRRRAAPWDGVYRVGLTGGVASGKSTVAAVWVARGARLVEADRLGHQVLEEPEVRDALVRAFGPEVLGGSGAVARAELARRAFASPDALARLNAISHPRLLAAARRALGAAAAGFRGVLVLEAALLVEWDLGEWCDEVVAVVAPPAERRARGAGQRGEAETLAARLALQLPDEVRVRYADRALANDGTLEELRRHAGDLADELWAVWRARESAGA